MALAELAEQLQIDQLEIIERNRVHEGQKLKILGAIGEGKAPTSVRRQLRTGRDPASGSRDDPMVFTETAKW